MKTTIKIDKLRQEALDPLHNAAYAEIKKLTEEIEPLTYAESRSKEQLRSYWSGYRKALMAVATYLIDYRQGIANPTVNHREVK
jgi:hypothetical protein